MVNLVESAEICVCAELVNPDMYPKVVVFTPLIDVKKDTILHSTVPANDVVVVPELYPCADVLVCNVVIAVPLFITCGIKSG